MSKTIICGYCNNCESKDYDSKKAVITVEQAEDDYYNHLRDCESYRSNIKKDELIKKICSAFPESQAEVLMELLDRTE
jgi:hypothetical protein